MVLATTDQDLLDGPPDPAEEPEELAGIPIEREWVAMAHDPERDAFSADARVKAWDRLEAVHEKNKGLKLPYSHGVWMLSGDMGSGKTLYAGMLGARQYELGMEVFSTTSFLFGRRIDPVDVYTLAESVPDHSFIFIDEAHALSDRYGENSIRQRTLSNSMAMLRKKGCFVVLASVHEERVAFSLKGLCSSIIYLVRYTPAARRRGKRMPFPPWCYVRPVLVGPNPFEGKRIADMWGLPRAQGTTRRVNRRPVNPWALYEAAKVIDTWQKPGIADGILTKADDIKSRVAGDDENTSSNLQERASEYLGAVANAINAGYDMEAERPSMEHARLSELARAHGWSGENKEGIAILKAYVGLNSQYKVSIDKLMARFKPRTS